LREQLQAAGITLADLSNSSSSSRAGRPRPLPSPTSSGDNNGKGETEINKDDHRATRRKRHVAADQILPDGEQARVVSAGKQYVLSYRFWLSNTIWDALDDPTYTPALRFSTPAMRIQGERAGVKVCLPPALRDSLDRMAFQVAVSRFFHFVRHFSSIC